tara:strand:+ start:5104 stop:5643 length:540 start_codon:yes stop_codon:yes gene_type:complete
MKLLKFSVHDEITELEVDIKSIKFIRKTLEKLCDQKGLNQLECVCKWTLEGYEINCYGFTEGDDTIRNTHVLPPYGDVLPIIQLYGCIFMVAVNGNKIRDLHIFEYAMLHYLNGDDDGDSEDGDDGDDMELNSELIEEETKIENDSKISITKKVKTSTKTKNNTSPENMILLELDTRKY